jgi:Tfp pilus assembly protein PilO
MNRRGISAPALAWTLKRSLIGLRWPGLLGLALLGLAIGFYALGVLPLHARTAALESEGKALASQLGTRGAVAPPPTQRSQLSNFYAFFPVVESLPELLGKVQAAARNNQLQLEKGEYRLSHEREFPLARYQVTLPVVGTYPQVRGFVNDVLDAVPAAALEELALKREHASDPQVEARVRFTVFLAVQQ